MTYMHVKKIAINKLKRVILIYSLRILVVSIVDFLCIMFDYLSYLIY
jgi:hypothetical protein